MPNSNNFQGNWPPFGQPVSSPFPDTLSTVTNLAGTPQQQYASAYIGPQPTYLDRLVASPPGRFTHDVFVQPLKSAAQLVPTLLGDTLNWATGPSVNQFAAPILSGWQADINSAVNSVESPYQNALAANRNTPGYAAALAQAQQQRGLNGVYSPQTGMTSSDQQTMAEMMLPPAVLSPAPQDFFKQVLSPFMPAASGAIGSVTGGWDASNAQADAQQQAQNAYANAYPMRAAAANLTGAAIGPNVPGMGELATDAGTTASTLRPVANFLNSSPGIAGSLSNAGSAAQHFDKGVDWLNSVPDAQSLLSGITNYIPDFHWGILGKPAPSSSDANTYDDSDDDYAD